MRDPQPDDVKFLLRMPAVMRAQLNETAKRNHRSMTAEIIYRLERSIRADERDVAWELAHG
jgi:hypothetical protein